MGPRIYRLLLGLLPKGFRDEYQEEMCRVAAEHWQEVRARRGPWAAPRFWGRQSWAVLRLAVTLRIGSGSGGGMARAYDPPHELYDDDGRWTMDGLRSDVRHAVRSLWKQPLFSSMTAATLALGIGASTALFSTVHAVLLRSLPYQAPDEMVAVFHEHRDTGERGDGLSAANARSLQEQADRLSAVAVADPWSMDLEVDGRDESLRGWAVTRGFFQAAGVEPSQGRGFLPEEYELDGPSVLLLSHGTWTTRFGADPAVVGGTLVLDGASRTVVGILPAGFSLPNDAEFWMPRPWQPWDEPSRAADYMMGLARLAPGATLDQASAEVERIAQEISNTYPQTSANTSFRLVPLRDHLFGDVRGPLLVLLGAVGFVLLIACANVAGLMLARGAERQREYALRGALGASSGRLVRYVVVESLVLAAVGGALGIAIAWGGVMAIRSLGLDHLPRIDELSLDRAVLLFALGTAVFSALAGGLIPSLRLARPDLKEMMSQGGRGTAGNRASLKLRNRLVVAEVAAAVVLVVGAGLLLKSFAVLLDSDLGFEAENRLAVQVFAYDYEDAASRARFVNQTIDRIEALPGVQDVALTTTVPGANDGTLAAIDVDLPFIVADRDPPPEGQEPRGFTTQVSAGYFDVMGIPLRDGRALERSDDGESPPVVVINETLARRHFPDQNPIGERILIGSGENQRAWEIVGVVGDVRAAGHASAPRPEIYRSLGQVGSGSLTFVIETRGDAAALTTPVREAIWEVEPGQSIWGAATVEELLAEWLKERRFNLLLLGGFALVSVLLAAVGIYGLVSYSVELRVGELGIRKALGGQASDIVSMVLKEGARLAALGVAIGVVGALVLTRFLEGMLYGVEPTDPALLTLLSVVVLGVASVAAAVPALRAARLDPLEALRED